MIPPFICHRYLLWQTYGGQSFSRMTRRFTTDWASPSRPYSHRETLLHPSPLSAMAALRWAVVQLTGSPQRARHWLPENNRRETAVPAELLRDQNQCHRKASDPSSSSADDVSFLLDAFQVLEYIAATEHTDPSGAKVCDS